MVVVSRTLPVASTTATLTPVRMPGSSPMVARGPAGAASSRSCRFLANTEIASASARSFSRASRSAVSDRASLRLPGQPHRLGQPRVGRAAALGDAEGDRDLALRPDAACPSSCGHVEIEVEDALVAAAQHGQRAVRGHVLDALAEVEIVGELGALLFLALHHLGRPARPRPTPIRASAPTRAGVLADALDQDVARAVERRLGVGDALVGVDELGGLRFRDRAPGSPAARRPAARGPASRAICALVRRLGL